MGAREEWREAKSFLQQTTQRLAAIPREEVARWPEWPQIPAIDLAVPDAFGKIQFTPMKDTLADGTIRIAVQMYRHHFLGIGSMTADGFFVEPGGTIRWFSEEDTWDVT